MKLLNFNKKKQKMQKGRIRLNLYHKANFFLRYGNLGIKAKEAGRITPKQLESPRRYLVRKLGRETIINFYLYPDYSISKKPLEVRMGKGKGNIALWVARCYKGVILIDILTLLTKESFQIIKKAKNKLPVNTKCLLLNY
jgi:large subunit ribosomal protein L16